MLKKSVLLVLLSLLFSCAGFAGTITFDPFPSIPPGVVVQYFDGGLTGPLAILPAPNTAALVSTVSAVPGGGDALLTWFPPSIMPNPNGVLFTFASPVSSFGLIGNDFGGDPINDNEAVNLSFFDGAGNFMTSVSANAPYAVPNLQPISDTGLDATYVAFTWTNDLGYYSIDNVTYESGGIPAPEPSALLLLGSGLGAVCLAARKK